MPSLSVVIPVYNSQASVEPLVTELIAQLDSLSVEYEVILVNDGSRDDSWRMIEQVAARFQRIRGMNLMRNYGQHNAVLAGIRAAAYDVIVTMDDDLQHPPREIPKLLAKLAEGFDVVYGVPEHEEHSRWRALASQATKLVLQSAMGAETARNISAFRAFRTDLREAFAAYQGPFVSIDVLLTWGTTKFVGIKVAHEPRRIGVSNYTVRKLIVHAVNLITGFSVLPLQLASIIGFSFTLFGMGILAYIMIGFVIHGHAVPGFAFVGSIIAIFSGAQLFAIGIIGEYLARIHFRLMDKPSYTVRRSNSKERS